VRILLYNDTYQHVGGAETYCLELLEELPKRGHEIFWMAHGDQKPWAKNHIVIPIMNEGKLNYLKSKYFFNPKAYQAIKEKLEENRPDVVHIHHDRYYTAALAKALLELQIPVVQTIHDYTLLCPSQYYPDLYYKNPQNKSRKNHCGLICSEGTCLPFQQKIGHPFAHDRKRKLITKRVQTFIAPSTRLKSYLEKANFKNVHYLPFFMDEKKWSFNAERKIKDKVLFVGRVETNKGIYLLINSIKKIKKEIPNVELMIAGGGSQVEPLKMLVEKEKLDYYISVVGFVDYGKIAGYYSAANVLVVPSLDMEQFGLIGIEALASGTAVIGSDTGGIPEWCIHEETGLLFDADHPEELTKNLLRMLTDDELRVRLVKQGMEHVKTVYNSRQHFYGLEALYESALPMR